MIFESDDDLENTKAYYDELGEGTAVFFSWTFANEDMGVLVADQRRATREEG